MGVYCWFERDGDYGYEMANGIYPGAMLPKIGEVVNVWYPDGGHYEKLKVVRIEKYFQSSKDQGIKFICEYMGEA